ncbi:unnamed protein product, partial [Candidula unifasciata]
CRVNVTLSPAAKFTSSSSVGRLESKKGAAACILCPLCRHECADSTLLESHLVKEHNVASEGLQRLMSMVDMPASMASSESFVSSLPTQHSAVDKTTATASISLSPEATPSASAASNSEAVLSRRPSTQTVSQSEAFVDNNPEQNGDDQMSCSVPKPLLSTGQYNLDTLLPTRSPPSPPCSTAPVTPFAAHVTSSSSLISSSSSQNPLLDNKIALILSHSDEDKEINLQILETEHANLLASEGVDLAAQEKLDKEYEDLFRCQTCSKSFSNIDQLYSHQNELGHLELKQTPRGPGYLCWKKGCNQYFRTASTLQVHFREIHTKKNSVGILSPQELELYKFKCGQCSFSFKGLEVMQRHTLFHLMQSVTQCRVCSKQANSVSKMRRHLEIEHGDMSLADMTQQMESMEANAVLLFSSPVYEQFTSRLLQAGGNMQSRNGISHAEKVIPTQESLVNGLEMKDNVERDEEYMDESDGGLEQMYNDKQFFEDYMNSQSMAEEHYKSSDRKFKCHKCRMGFTNQRYLFAHNKTSVHRRNEFPDNFDDLPRPYRCDICKESFTHKNLLLVHYNSVSHLHKIKQQSQINGDTSLASSGSQLTPPLTSSPKVNSPSVTSLTNGSYNALLDSTPGSSIGIKPYKCNICKVSYNNQPSIEIHLRSVGHKTKASKLGELIQTGQVDVHQALIEHPDPRTAGKQQAQIIADMIHQQATAQAASSAAASYFNIQGINAMTQLSLLGIIPPPPSYMMTSQQNALAAMSNAQLEAYYSSITSQFCKEGNRSDSSKLQSSREFAKEKSAKTSSHSESEKIINMIIKQDGKIEPAGTGNRSVSGAAEARSSVESKSTRKDDDLPPNFHAPIIARPRGFMGRFKPQLHRSLLENFGFECVMHFNEEHTGKQKETCSREEDVRDEDENTEERKEKDSPDKDIKIEVDDNNDESKDKENVTKEDELKDNESEMKDERKDENKENIDLPELNKCKCTVCHKDFSNVWVLKNHEEEVHNNFVSPEVIEDFGQKFREGWEKHLPKPVEHETVSFPQPSPTPPSPSNAILAPEKVTPSEMPPPPPPPSSQMSANYDMSQLLPLMSMNLLPMHLSMNLVNLGLQSSLMPSLMMSPMDLGSGFLSQMPSQSLVDSAGSVSSQQQLQAAAAAAVAAQNQKRVRTRISDDQLKVLRQYFDINNSPSEEQINKMSDQTGLPQKVIKHWFRNTLFKERQRNKDSPYNFNNPPSTSIDLDEYDRTGKIPEIKIEPEEDDDGDTNMVVDVKTEMLVPAEENADEKIFEQDTEMLENIPLKIDLSASAEHFDERRKDPESHSSSSSPSMSSIPSTPTASGPTTPTPMISTNPINTANPLTFSLDAYAANIARLEAATFQSMGKRANRTRFTDFQIKTLQDYFERNAYPKDDELEHLSKMLGLSARVIVVWFQNARQKARKIYENQPVAESVKDSVSPFQRTPGQNYQCKKCNSVFQRYYELIKHQKSSCVGESNNNKPILSLTEDDSNFSYSNDDSIISERQSTPLSGTKDRDVLPRSQPIELLSQSRYQLQENPSRTQPQELLSSASSTVTTKVSTASVAPVTTSLSSSSSSSSSSAAAAVSSSIVPFFTCDTCNLTFSRFDMWQEHQKAHSIAPAIYTPFSSSSAFGMLQTLAHQEDNKAALPLTVMSTASSLLPSVATMHVSPPSSQPSALIMTQVPTSTSPTPSSKRKTDSEDESGEQPRDKRLRTTILPEQLDYLYQQYQIDCNPSRKQLEHIANTVNLKKRVVQVWFQNTRARERKGHYRAHQQLINKRCPFCRALFRAKSALESHLATKHPEEMAKGDINIDLIPDAVIEPPVSHVHSSLPTSLGHGLSSAHTTADLSKLLPHGAASTMPNYMAFLSSGGLNLPFPGPAPEMLGHPSFEDPFFKKYMSDLASSMVARQELSGPPSHSYLSAPPAISAHSTHKPPANPAVTSFISTTRPLDAHKPRSTSQPPPPPAVPSSEDAPLDLSKPIKPPASDTVNEVPQRSSFSGNLDFNERPVEMDYLRRLSSMDDSFSETQSEMADHEYMNDIGSSPPSPSRSINGPHHSANSSCGAGKRYRTQMSAVQVIIEHTFFIDHFSVAFIPQVQDHIFTKAHIDRVKAFLNAQGDRDPEVSSSSISSVPRSQGIPSGINVKEKYFKLLLKLLLTICCPAISGESSGKNQDKESQRKENKSEALNTKDEQQQAHAAMEMTMNAQMLSALGGYMPGLDPAYLSYMYGGLPGYFPGMGLSMMQSGLMPEHMLAYDPLVFGTPLTLLQIPGAAIKSVSDKLSEAGAVLARYTQDCQALADLHNIVSTADLTVAAEATLDVGYICKKCQMVYPARESCIAHQRSVCMASSSSLPKGFEPIMKLEQVQYECRACNERFSTIMEFKIHCQQEAHKQRLMKFKAREAARREAAGSPSSSAPYSSSSSSSTSKVISPSLSHPANPLTPSPLNNNSSSHNNNQATAPKPHGRVKTSVHAIISSPV